MKNKIFTAIKVAGNAFFESLYNNQKEEDMNSTKEDGNIEPYKIDHINDSDNNTNIEEQGDNETQDTIIPNDNLKKDISDNINEPEKSLDNPQIRLKTSYETDSGSYMLGFSIQGRAHIMSDIPCQDYHAFEDLGDGWYLSITSDGAGTAREAERGSKANCDFALRLIKQLLEEKKWKENNYLPTDKEWYIEIRNILEVIQTIIIRNISSMADNYKEEQKKALLQLEEELKSSDSNEQKRLIKKIESLKESIQEPLEPRDFNATINILLISPKGMMTAHIGDGRMGYLSNDDEWKSLMTPHKGDEASATIFIPNNWNRQLTIPEFKMSNVYLPETNVIEETPKAFVLMSDGCESFTWICSEFDKERNIYYDPNLPFERFFNPLIERLNEIQNKEERINEMIDIINIGTKGGKKELDDRTMILGVLKQ